MQKRGFFDFLSELLQLFWAITVAGANTTEKMAQTYLKAISKLAFYTVIVMALSVFMMVLGVHFQASALNAFSILLVGLVLIAWSILLWPVTIIREFFYRLRRPIDAVTRLVSIIGFSTLVIATYFFTVPVWSKPGLIPLALTTFVAIFYVYSEKGALDKKALRSKLVFLVIFLTVTFYYPQWNESVAEFLAEIKEQAEVAKTQQSLPEAKASTSPVVSQDDRFFEATLELPVPPRRR